MRPITSRIDTGSAAFETNRAHYHGLVETLRERMQWAVDGGKGRERSIHGLSTEKPADLFELVQRYTFLAPLVDTEYGSATFIDVSEPARFEVLVSTTGLLIRDIGLGAR